MGGEDSDDGFWSEDDNDSGSDREPESLSDAKRRIYGTIFFVVFQIRITVHRFFRFEIIDYTQQVVVPDRVLASMKRRCQDIFAKGGRYVRD